MLVFLHQGALLAADCSWLNERVGSLYSLASKEYHSSREEYAIGDIAQGCYHSAKALEYNKRALYSHRTLVDTCLTSAFKSQSVVSELLANQQILENNQRAHARNCGR